MASSQKKDKTKSTLKKFTIGFEVEFFIIDKEGKIAPGADAVLKKVEEKTAGAAHTIVREVAENMIEVGSYPDTEGSNTMKSLLDGLKLVSYAANEAGYGVLPLGTYPGKFTPTIRVDPRYEAQAKLFGKTRFQIAGRVAGYHCHYALPWGVFDAKTLMLKSLSDSKNQEYLVNAFNFLIAIDPAITAFMQSSPFYQGRHLAKDSRLLVYRGSEELGYNKGLYANHPRFGSLPKYVHAGTDLIGRIEDRYTDWLKMLKDAGVLEKKIPVYRSILDTNWSPVKVNPHGTLEHRGMDMNRLPVLLSVSILIQTLLRYIQEGHVNVIPHDSAKLQPFSVEDNTIYIPPDTHVKKNLQNLSAKEGLANDEVFHYCKRLLSLVKFFEGDALEPLLRPLTTMLSERQTTSDKILAQAKSLGYKDMRKILPQGIASEIALTHSRQMFEDIVLVEEMIEAQNRLTA
ncbi:hypothetical protein EPO56_01580 [Patescibacteria group bacterium]|nr:MAG: hypothetical protein EPO56_01580 [Patescibacteria group bacterium]